MNTAETMAQSLPENCVVHLEKEIETLDALNQSLSEVAQALREHDTQRLPMLIESQQSRMKDVARVRKERQRLRGQIAMDQAISEDTESILSWAETLPEPDRTQVLNRRNRLSVLADESSRLAQTNMAVVQQGMLVLSQVLECLTGEDTTSDRYTSSGNIHSPSSPPLATKSTRE